MEINKKVTADVQLGSADVQVWLDHPLSFSSVIKYFSSVIQ